MMALVVKQIKVLGVKVQHIPGGCTGLVDVRVAKLLKDVLRNRLESWMTEEEAEQDSESPRREQIDSEKKTSTEKIANRHVDNHSTSEHLH